MAFNSTAGYGNLPNGAFSPVNYSKKVLLILKKKAVYDLVTNTEFEGEVNQQGDTVQIIQQPQVTVQNYTRGQNLTIQNLTDQQISLVVDQGKSYAFPMDDIELKQEHVSFENMASDSAAYALRDAVDIDILSTINSGVSATTALGAVTVGFGPNNTYTPMDLLSAMARILDEQNVPEEDRWFVGSPKFYEALRREDSKVIDAMVMGTSASAARDPRLFMSLNLHGFTMLKSNNLPTSGTVMLAGHKQATATATSILESEMIRNPNSFGNIYRGLLVYGRKVLRPKALVNATVTLGDA
jgi:hypothetical protein